MEETAVSLMERFKTECVMLVRDTEIDGAGGAHDTWRETAHFYPAIVEKSHTEPENGEKKRAKAFYEVYVPRNFVIGYHSVFKRLSDERVFRVTSNPQDRQTPMGATFSFAYVTAEEWRIPNDKK